MSTPDGVQVFEGDGEARPFLTLALIQQASKELVEATGHFLIALHTELDVASLSKYPPKAQKAVQALEVLHQHMNLRERGGYGRLRDVEWTRNWFNKVIGHALTWSEAFGTPQASAELVMLLGVLEKWRPLLTPQEGK